MNYTTHTPAQTPDLAPRVIELLPERTRAELEAVIDAPLTGEAPGREQAHDPAGRPGGDE